jgi:type I restriction enzyme M protein
VPPPHPEQYAAIHNGANFVGLDNDRTMARIGWMNLVLHDVHRPAFATGRQSLSKRDPAKSNSRQLLESESYDFVLANPPFTGTVDSGDLEPDSAAVPPRRRVAARRKTTPSPTRASCCSCG